MKRFSNPVLLFSLICILITTLSCIKAKEPKPFDGTPEEAVIVNRIHSPAFHGGDMHGQTVVNIKASSCGGCADGEFSIGPPEWYAVIYRCEHGVFIIQEDQEQAKVLYQKLSKGQRVTVTYKVKVTARLAPVNTQTGESISLPALPQYVVEDIIPKK